MSAVSIAQPDITLFLDPEGMIRKVSLSSAYADEPVDGWLGRAWLDTVGDGGIDDIRRMVEEVRGSDLPAFRQIVQRFPSGREVPMEYTAVRLGRKAGLVAIGRNLQAVADLQSRLVAAQQAMERDYWKLREIETRYRLLFDASNEAVLLIDAAGLRVLEANPSALRVLGVAPVGRDFLSELAPQEREPFRAMLVRVRDVGRAPGVLVHLGREREPWLVRASLMAADPGRAFLLQLAAVGATRRPGAPSEPVLVEDLIERVPDGFVALDGQGVILRANRAFLDQVQIAQGSVVGERLGRWLWQPGADVAVLLASVRRHGVVKLFPTVLHGELGTETQVEISAAGDGAPEPRTIAVVCRDTGPRLKASADKRHVGGVVGGVTEQLGRTPLPHLVRDTVGVVERQYVEAALRLTGGNRTAAALLLGLSRQSFYAKLNRYGLDGGGPAADGAG